MTARDDERCQQFRSAARSPRYTSPVPSRCTTTFPSRALGDDPTAPTTPDAMTYAFGEAGLLEMPISYNGQWTCYENRYPAKHAAWHLDGSEIPIFNRTATPTITSPRKCANATVLSLFGTAGTQC